jgi:leucyl-tRNA synthetase
MSKYIPSEFEVEIAKKWAQEKIYCTPPLEEINEQNKIYILSMFPYPSGDGLHVGHVRIYTGTDVMARYFRMKGKKVLHPMGWDAFGLPAENAAIKRKANPLDMVPNNIANFKRQMQLLGFSYDWEKEIATIDPEYYKWTQWLFIQFFKQGLLYKKNTPINFCPKCKTGLAEEEVLSNNTHERCGSMIEKKELPQWIFKITQYASRLLEDLKQLDWPEGILTMQKNWIGKKEGVTVKFSNEKEVIEVFTTRIDTIYGVVAIVVAPEHNLAQKVAKNNPSVRKYLEDAKKKSELQRQDITKEKTGVNTGCFVYHPLTHQSIPVWVGDYVLPNFGTGAVMVVPAHDQRDFEFAKKYALPIKQVIIDKNNNHILNKAFEGEGHLINSQNFDGLSSEIARQKIACYLEEQGLGKKQIVYHLRDWIFSRQRYWGEPIPMVECPKCGWVPLDEKDLPLKLPYIKSYEPTQTGQSPLSVIASFVNATCPVCGGPAKRETDTMPNWAGSCWYFLAFAFDKKLFKTKSANLKTQWLTMVKSAKKVLPVDWYLGGAEHAVLHLLYARFWIKALQDLGLVNFSEPFLRLRNVGMVQGEDGRKMSKSLGNVINPDEVVKEYGADTLRLYEMFMAPFNFEVTWSTRTLQGSYRFLNRIWNLYTSGNLITDNISNEDQVLVAKLNKTILKVEKDLIEFKFNTAIASMMEWLNFWEKEKRLLTKINAKKFLQILAPFAPFITEKLWEVVFKETTSIHLTAWPRVNNNVAKEASYILPLQVNGKMRSSLKTSELEEQQVIAQALADPKIQRYLNGKKYKTIYKKGKILNFILDN